MLRKPYKQIVRAGANCHVYKPFHDARWSPLGLDSLGSYELLKQDLRTVFAFVEPSEANLGTYSHRIFELYVRSCMEVENLCKVVFAENGVELAQNEKNIIRYSDLDGAMKLSEYCIKPVGVALDPFAPFEAFGKPRRDDRSPEWYRDYNCVKHSRLQNFDRAKLKNVICSVGGVFVLICAQYAGGFDYEVQLDYMGQPNNRPDLFQVVKLPNWTDDEKYDYSPYSVLRDPEPFARHPLPIIGDR